MAKLMEKYTVTKSTEQIAIYALSEGEIAEKSNVQKVHIANSDSPK